MITDEVSQDLDVAVKYGRARGIRHFAVRSMWGRNVFSLTDTELDAAARCIAANGGRASAVMSPLYKCALSDDLAPAPHDPHFVGFEGSWSDQERLLGRVRAIVTAFDAPLLRVFSFLRRENIAVDRDAWQRIMAGLQLAMAAAGDVTVCVENEYKTNLDTISTTVDYLTRFARRLPDIGVAVDPSNHHRSGGPDCLTELRRTGLLARAADIHLKDRTAGGEYVPLGTGDVGWPDILAYLQDEGYAGFLTLECHLRGDLDGVSRSIDIAQRAISVPAP